MLEGWIGERRYPMRASELGQRELVDARHVAHVGSNLGRKPPRVRRRYRSKYKYRYRYRERERERSNKIEQRGDSRKRVRERHSGANSGETFRASESR
jgi:hypothetical protein